MDKGDDTALAFAALWASIHNTRILVNRGLASPADVEEVYGSILEAIDTLGSERLQASARKRYDQAFVELREYAKRLYRPPDRPSDPASLSE
jgi:hypothetical protein